MRIRKRKTLREVSQESGISTGTLSMLENDKTRPSRATKEKLEEYWEGEQHADRNRKDEI